MRATHNGACQVCGSFQAVHPKTHRVAKHGYTTRWGFFSGVCPGSDHLPWELSCDLIARYRDDAKAQADRLDAEIEQLTSDFSGNEAWVQRYHAPRFEGRKRIQGYYTWHKVALEVETRRHEYKAQTVQGLSGTVQLGEDKTVEWNVVVYQMVDETGKTERKDVTLYGGAATVANAVQTLNARRAFELKKEVTQRRMYVHWQQERLDSWTLKELTHARVA